ncbi:hypothetical protein [Pseudoxanthomonas mexicana]|uniref:hypothetical protein n=1 Tax=Pseudoxanthomonas mexicana TaxID=128785 RepID=UPI0028A74A0E|nr:hypothetical protein [Pseudoxanthomonas mexicana]
MSVTSQIPRKVSTAAPGATLFPYDFKVLSKFDMEVQVDGVTKTVDVDYTLTGVGLDSGGDITFVTPMGGGETVMRRRAMAYERSNDFQQLGDLRSPTLNNDQDAPIMMIQQVADAVSRSLTLPPSSTASAQLTDIQALKPLVGNAAGTAFEFGDTELTGDMLLRPNLASADSGNGADLVAAPDTVAPAYLKTVSDMLNAGEVDALRGIPRSEWSAIQSGSSAYNAAAALNSLLSAMKSRGGTLVLPNGKISISSGLLLDYTGLANDEGNTRIVIRGQGSKSSEIKLTATSGAALRVLGSWPFSQSLQLSNMRLTGGGGTSRALLLESCASVRLDDVVMRGAQYGMECVDVLSLQWLNSAAVFNSYGILARKNTLTFPNLYNFVGGSIGGNGIYGADFQGGCLTNMIGVGIEGNGLSEATAANAWGVRLYDTGTEGRAAGCLSGCYFEGNKGQADLWVNQLVYEVALSVQGCTFNRLSSTDFTVNNVRLQTSSTGKISAMISGNGFMRAGTYAANSGRRTILGTGASRSISIHETCNVYSDLATDGPVNPGRVVEDQLVPQAYARFGWGGSSIITQASRHIQTITRYGTGDYEVVWDHDMASASPCYIISAEGEYKYALVAEGANYVRFAMTNDAGAAVDPTRVYVTVFG